MTKFRCRFGVRVPFFPNAGIVVFYLPADIAAKVSEAITAVRLYAQGTKWEREVDRIVWEAREEIRVSTK